MGRRLALSKTKAVAPPSIKAETVVKTVRKTVSRKNSLGTRLWMKIDQMGRSESVEWDKNTLMGQTSISARDLRILLSFFSQSTTILAREKAMIINLEFIRAIVTAEEVLLLDPLRQEVLQFADRLKRHLTHKSQMETHQINEMQSPASPILEDELPFEFQVLEIALEVVFEYLDSSIAELERDAYPALVELINTITIPNLEHVRSLKSNLIRLLTRVQKVRDEIEHLLNDDEDMSQMYLTRKWKRNQRMMEALSDSPTSKSNMTHTPHRLGSFRSGSLMSNCTNVDDLEMLLEAFFTQFDATLNKILSVREYIDDTEDYVRIQLDNKRNEILRLQLTLAIASFSIGMEFFGIGTMSLNIPYSFYSTQGIFVEVSVLLTTGAILLFFLIWGYARWKNLLGS